MGRNPRVIVVPVAECAAQRILRATTGCIAEPAAPSVFLAQPVAEGAAESRAQRIRYAVAEFAAERGAQSAAIIEPVAERAAGPGAEHVLSRAGASAHGQGELHNEPE